MRICLISFDIWGYDEKIVSALKAQGHEAIHIKISNYKYKYKNFSERLINSFSKIFLKKNIKKIKAEEYILDSLKKHSKFDKIIVINPEWISKDTHLKIKENTKSYITYLYDSLDRYDAKHLLSLFDKIFSFDKNDAAKYNLNFLPNYIHFSPNNSSEEIKYDIFSIASVDERFDTFRNIITYFNNNNISHLSIFFNKKKPANFINGAVFTNKRIEQEETLEYIQQSNIILDILRPNQSGLSFRIFDALALNKKVITTNKSVKEYDFYNPNNILILDLKNVYIPKKFITSGYEKIPNEIFLKYTLENWLKIILD